MSTLYTTSTVHRPNDLDKAILRRMPISIQMPVPDAAGRKDILLKSLKGEVLSAGIDLDSIADGLEGFTGSDIREFVRVVVLQRNKELIDLVMEEGFDCDAVAGVGGGGGGVELDAATEGTAVVSLASDPVQSRYSVMVDAIIDRPLKQSDFDAALCSTKPTGNGWTEWHQLLMLSCGAILYYIVFILTIYSMYMCIV